MKAELLLTIAIGVLGPLSYAQQINPPPPNRVGIQTREASQTLDVNGTTRLRILPQVGDTDNQTIYNGQASRITPFEPIYQVVANEDGVLGVFTQFSNKIFMLPMLYLPLDFARKPFYYTTSSDYLYEEKDGSIVMNLTEYGLDQLQNMLRGFSYYGEPGVAKNPRANIRNKLFRFEHYTSFNIDKIYFYITYYDTDVYTDVNIIEGTYKQQLLTYKVKPGAKATSKTYMNVVMVPRS